MLNLNLNLSRGGCCLVLNLNLVPDCLGTNLNLAWARAALARMLPIIPLAQTGFPRPSTGPG